MSGVKKLNRAWVKNAAIIFLALMLVLTFFSNTIMNRSLPEVAVEYTQSGTISAKIRGTGTVSANQTYEVNFNQSREVAAVHVKTGDTIQVGDVLFTLADKESDELKAAKDTLNELNLAYRTALVDAADPDYSQLNREIQTAQEALNNAIIKRDTGSVPQSVITETQQRIKDLTADLADLQQELNDTGFPSADAAAILAQERKIDDLERQIDNPDEDDDVDALEVELDRAREDLDLMEEAIDISIEINERNNELTEAKADLVELQEKTDWDTADKAVREAQAALDDKLFALEQAKKEDGKTGAKEQLSLESQRQKITDQQKLVNELQAESVDTVVTAAQAGIVTSINISAGQTSTPGQPLAVVEAPDLGYSLSFAVTNEQAKKVRVGDSAEVTNYYWGSNVQAKLTNIKNDPDKPGQGKLLVFSLSGEEVESGAQLTLAIGQPSANYDVIVPNSALRSDANGDFILIVIAKQTPLGNRYIADRVDVQVLAKDDTKAAISGALTGWDYVITTGNKPVEPGMQVRLAE